MVTLSSEHQGIWFTFVSLSAMTILADLGFTLLITQFISHEFVNVSLQDGFIRGKREKKDKFFSLVKYAIRFYIVVIPVLVILMITIGLYIFRNDAFTIKLAWVLFSIIGAINLFTTLLQSIYQGLDRVSEVYRSKTIGTLLFFFVALATLFLEFNIWSIVVATIISTIYLLLSLYRYNPKFWHQLYRYKLKTHYEWMNEIIKLQGKYAISWSSGYAIFHLLIPFVYSTIGATAAGQIGATVSLISGLSYMSMMWIEAKIPKFNMLIAKGQKINLDKLFSASSKRGVIVFFIGSILLLMIVDILEVYQLSDRLLEKRFILLLLFAELAVLVTGMLAKYLRAHKSEPFYMLSVLNAVLVISCIFIVIPAYSLEFYFYTITFIYWFISLPISVVIFHRFVNKFYNT